MQVVLQPNFFFPLPISQVFQVLLKWADGLNSGLGPEGVVYLKKSLKKADCTVLPTLQDKWVSLHPNFGLVCWCDDKKLKKHFKHVNGIDFLYLGKLSKNEKEMLQTKVSVLMRTLGIPALSEVRSLPFCSSPSSPYIEILLHSAAHVICNCVYINTHIYIMSTHVQLFWFSLL